MFKGNKLAHDRLKRQDKTYREEGLETVFFGLNLIIMVCGMFNRVCPVLAIGVTKSTSTVTEQLFDIFIQKF